MFIKTFTDPQGVSHTNAVFEVAHANYTENTAENYSFNVEASTSTTNSSDNKSLQYRMYYWVNQAARDLGNLPYVLANSTTGQVGEIHYLNDFDATYEGLSAQAKAEKHCQEVVLVESI